MGSGQGFVGGRGGLTAEPKPLPRSLPPFGGGEPFLLPTASVGVRSRPPCLCRLETHPQAKRPLRRAPPPLSGRQCRAPGCRLSAGEERGGRGAEGEGSSGVIKG